MCFFGRDSDGWAGTEGIISFPLKVKEQEFGSRSSGTFCYNAKAHPHLSQANELLISYNVNTFSNADQKANSDIYRPRFIRLIAQ